MDCNGEVRKFRPTFGKKNAGENSRPPNFAPISAKPIFILHLISKEKIDIYTVIQESSFHRN